MNLSTQNTTYLNYDGIEFKNNIVSLLKALSDREEYIIRHRFAIDLDEKETLERIGKHFSITRERVRQIENNALKKLQRIVTRTKATFVNNFARKIIEQKGGIVSERRIVAELLNIFKDPSKVDVSAIRLSLSTDSDLDGSGNTINFEPHWRLKSSPKDRISAVCSNTIKYLKKKKDVVPYSELFEYLSEKIDTPEARDNKFILSVIEIDKRIKMLDTGIGLKEWRHIHPRTLRDKIYFILRDQRTPLHFVDISNKISSASFDHKTVNTQAVHNELIRCSNFVLIGRGLYALKEWGYEHGTISDIIQAVLEEKGELSRDDIIKEVLKKRKVKRISIIVTLKNRSQFKRIGRDIYRLEQ
ncbi:hypothetical protein KKG71_05115 [Patescibacteria group bacterium]|nr:hypothetical protein [Patescibacteria group bacterium]